jgi:hypothetical protein
VVQALHEGEGHYGGAEKTRLKVADRYWFPQLTDFVREFVKLVMFVKRSEWELRPETIER